MSEPLIDVAEAARWLKIKEKTLRNLVAKRRVQFTRIGRYVRFSQADLDAIIAAGRVGEKHIPHWQNIADIRSRHRNQPTGPEGPPPPPPGPKDEAA